MFEILVLPIHIAGPAYILGMEEMTSYVSSNSLALCFYQETKSSQSFLSHS